MQTEEDLKGFYTEEYVLRFERSLRVSGKRLARLLPLFELRDNDVVVDLGCGTGALIHHIHARVRECHGIDFSPIMIERANEYKAHLKSENVHFHCGDIVSFCGERPNSFDVAFAMDLSEHVPDTEWLDILAAVRGALPPSGRFILHTPNGEFLIEIMKHHNFMLKQFPEHVAVRNADENVALLKQAGFTDIHVNFLPHYNVLAMLHPLRLLPWVGRYFKARLFLSARK